MSIAIWRKQRAVGALVRVALLVFCVSFVSRISATTITSAQIAGTRVIVPAGVLKGSESGLQLLHDYGAFQLYRIDAAHLSRLNATQAGNFTTLSNRIEFDADSLDTTSGVVSVPAALRLTKASDAPSLQIVQFIGPIAREWLDALSASGIRVVQYIPNNAYIVRTDSAARNALAQMASDGSAVQFATDYEPYYKLDARLAQRVRAGLASSNELDITLQVVAGADSATTQQQVMAIALATLGDWFDTKAGQAIRLHVTEPMIAQLAQLDGVFALEVYQAPHRMDERQDQILAGIFTSDKTGPSAPGYLSELQTLGFGSDPNTYPTVAVVDDGIGNGNAAAAAGDPVFRKLGDTNAASRLLNVKNCTTDAAGDGAAGHGHINSSIVGGYDVRAGFPNIDPLGYARGLGVNPYVNLTHVKIFKNSGNYDVSQCSNTDAAIAAATLASGAYISSNSWGSDAAGAYDVSAQAYDIATRDANTTTAGNQPMVFVFSAGNSGPGATTIGSPGTAKNVITVGASENFRPLDEDGNWTDGCGVDPTGADNAMDVGDFSSRGPASGARTKPELIAPGTHIQGTASTDGASYDGSGVCDKYHPSKQTVYAASTGTSHSTPAVAGTASLVAAYMKQNFQATNPNYATANTWPSAAALKAYMMAHATYLTGASANDTLPSNSQGFGMPNLESAFDNQTARYVNDQQNVFTNSGQTFVWTGTVASTTLPVKIAMAFSDAPGATNGNPVVNNLDLIVTNNGKTYRGNVFNGQYSTTGGTADAANNYEAVILPPGTSGNLTITIVAANIAGDGVPNNATTTDQDFALVCSNCNARTDIDIQYTPASFQVCAGQTVPVNATVYAVNGFTGSVALSTSGLPVGATLNFTPSTLTPTATTSGTLTTTGVATGSYTIAIVGTHGGTSTSSVPAPLVVSAGLPTVATLSSPTNNAYGVSPQPTFTWAAVDGALTYKIEIDDDPAFGSVDFSATVSGTSYTPPTNLKANTKYYWRVTAQNTCGNAAVSAVFNFVSDSLVCAVTTSTDVPKTISSSGTPTITSTLATTQSGLIRDVDVVNLNGTHTWINDLSFQLQLVNGPTVAIMNQSCSSQDNFYLSLDDAATGTWPCPPVNTNAYPANRYKPSHPLSAFNNQPATANWILTVSDHANGDGGALNGWGLNVCTDGAPTRVGATDDTYEVNQGATLTVAAPGVLVNDHPASGLTATATVMPAHGTLALNADGSFTYVPAAGYCGSDGFVYSATDGSTTDTANAAIDVVCPPVANNDAITTVQGGTATALSSGATSVLTNDIDTHGDALSAVLVAGPAHGTLTLNADGTFSFTHDNSATTSDSFTYNACTTGGLCSGVATVAISIDLNPVAGCTVWPQVVKEGDNVSLALAGLFVDPDGDTLTYSVQNQPANLQIDSGSGVLSGVIAAGAAAQSPYLMTVKATDPHGASDTRTLSITVLSVLDALFRGTFEAPSAAVQCH